MSDSFAILKSTKQLMEWRSGLTGSVGFVPTMGALHEGHAKLIETAVKDCNHAIVSVFVNPTQFEDKADLEAYPQTLTADMDLVKRLGAQALFLPTVDDMYPDGFRYIVEERDLSKRLCGAHRPGHFSGMLTVVLKLLNLVQPSKSYFGEKDYQQLLLIEGMVKAFFLNTEIVRAPTVREKSGLALSSRNSRLNGSSRDKAPEFHKILRDSSSEIEAKVRLEDAGFVVDYVEDYDSRRLAAVYLDKVRLIDNVEI